MPSSRSPSREARDAFLRVYQEDLAAGALRSLPEYQQLFPGHEEEIADEYSFLEDGEDTQTQRGSSRSGEDLPDPALERQTIGPYRLLRELGRGGQAIVFLAIHRSLGRRVALKIRKRDAVIDLGSESELRRFRREAALTSRLEHPAICSIYDAGEADGYAYIAMRYVEGRSLAERIAGHAEGNAPTTKIDAPSEADEPLSSVSSAGVLPGKAEIPWIVGLIEKVARALHVAHEQGLIHRDIKPANIMVDKDGEPVILDFGLAREEESKGYSLTRPGDLMGTPYYMAPEQLEDRTTPLDRRTDVYGLGITLFEALTLKRPFEAESRQSLYQKILHQHPPDPRLLNRAIPRDLHVVIQKALAKKIEHRYATTLEFAEDLRRVRSFEPVHARAVGPLLRIARWTRKYPAFSLMLLLLAFFACGFVVNLLQRDSELAALRHRLERHLELTRLHTLERLTNDVRDELWPSRATFPELARAWHLEKNALASRRSRFEEALAILSASRHEAIESDFQRAGFERLLAGLDELSRWESRLERRRAIRERWEALTSSAAWAPWCDAVGDESEARRPDLLPLTGEAPFTFLHLPTCSLAEDGTPVREDGVRFRGLPGGLSGGEAPVFVSLEPPSDEQLARAARFAELEPRLLPWNEEERARLHHRLDLSATSSPLWLLMSHVPGQKDVTK